MSSISNLDPAVNFGMIISFENMQLLIENPRFFFNMFNLISTPNRMSMRQLLDYGLISYNQLRSGLMKLFYQLYETPIECRIFRLVLNSHVTSYLQSITYKYHRFSFVSQHLPDHINIRNPITMFSDYGLFYEIPVVIENNAMLSKRKVTSKKCTDELIQSDKIDSNDQKMIEESSLSLEIPVKVEKGESEVSFSPNKSNSIQNKQLSVVSDFQSFLSPLVQDYSKSSEGYTCQNKSPDDKTKLENTCNVFNDHDFLNIEKAVDSSELSTSDDENYDPDQDFIISRYFNSLQSSSGNCEVNCNEVSYDSDSDDSVVFSENIVSDMQGEAISEKCIIDVYDKKIELDVSISYYSDSDDDVEFLEHCDNKCVIKTSTANMKNIFDAKNYPDSETSDDDLFQNYNGTDSNSFLQDFDSSFRMNNKFSLSQDLMTGFTTEGFINPCFEDDSIASSGLYLRSINDKWQNTMQNVPSEPRQPKRVSFVPLPDLVSVHTFEPDEDGYKYSLFVLDQLRFRNRIEEFEGIIKPYLSSEHRAKIYHCYYSSNN